MKKLDSEKKAIVLHENMSKKKVSLNFAKAEPLVKNINKQLEVLSKSLTMCESILNKMAIKKMIASDKNFIQCARKCLSQAQAAKSVLSNLDLKFCDDQKSVLIQELDERISYLEMKMAKMK